MKKQKNDIIAQFTKEITKVNLVFKQYIQYQLRKNNIDLTAEMLQVLSCLWQTDGINQQEIANITVKDKASMTYLIDNLAKRKLVYRQEDEKDRRNKLIFLTTEGKSLQEEIQPWLADMYTAASKEIPIETIKEHIALLEKLRGNLRTDES